MIHFSVEGQSNSVTYINLLEFIKKIQVTSVFNHNLIYLFFLTLNIGFKEHISSTTFLSLFYKYQYRDTVI